MNENPSKTWIVRTFGVFPKWSIVSRPTYINTGVAQKSRRERLLQMHVSGLVLNHIVSKIGNPSTQDDMHGTSLMYFYAVVAPNYPKYSKTSSASPKFLSFWGVNSSRQFDLSLEVTLCSFLNPPPLLLLQVTFSFAPRHARPSPPSTASSLGKLKW